MERSGNYILLFFFAGSLIGWCWEALVYWWLHRDCPVIFILLNYRGVLHGSWVPIYGFGCVFMLLLGSRMKQHPFRFFVSEMIACGVMEYATSYILEKLFHAKWWDYSNSFLNLNGRICASSLLFFGLAGMAVIYFVEPWFYSVTGKIPAKMQKRLVLLLLGLFVLDVAASLVSPNMGIGVRGIGA